MKKQLRSIVLLLSAALGNAHAVGPLSPLPIIYPGTSIVKGSAFSEGKLAVGNQNLYWIRGTEVWGNGSARTGFKTNLVDMTGKSPAKVGVMSNISWIGYTDNDQAKVAYRDGITNGVTYAETPTIGYAVLMPGESPVKTSFNLLLSNKGNLYKVTGGKPVLLRTNVVNFNAGMSGFQSDVNPTLITILQYLDDSGNMYISTNENTPVLVDTGVTALGEGMSYARHFTTGAIYSSYVWFKGAALWGMGTNLYGELGVGDMSPRNAPTLLSNNAIQASVHKNGIAILLSTGNLYGAGESARVATLGATVPLSPILLLDGGNVADVRVTYNCYVAQTTDGNIWVSSYYNDERLGFGSMLLTGNFTGIPSYKSQYSTTVGNRFWKQGTITEDLKALP